MIKHKKKSDHPTEDFFAMEIRSLEPGMPTHQDLFGRMRAKRIPNHFFQGINIQKGRECGRKKAREKHLRGMEGTFDSSPLSTREKSAILP